MSSKDTIVEALLVVEESLPSRGGGRDTRLAQYNALPSTAKQARQSASLESDAHTFDTALSVTSQDLQKAAFAVGGKKFVFQPLPESGFEHKVLWMGFSCKGDSW